MQGHIVEGPYVVEAVAKTTLGHGEGEWVENRDQEIARTHRRAQEAHQPSCKRCQAQRLVGKHHELIQENQVPQLHLQDRHLIREGVSEPS